MKETTLDELEQLTEESISMIENNPRVFGSSWEQLTGWAEKVKDGKHGEDVDPSAYAVYDEDHWRENAENLIWHVKNGKVVLIEVNQASGVDWDWDWDTVESFEEDCDEIYNTTALMNPFYTHSKNNLYLIDVVRTGEDPLGKIMRLQENHKGVATVTVTSDGFTFERNHGPVVEPVQESIKQFLGGSLVQLLEDIEEIGAKVGVVGGEEGDEHRYFFQQIDTDKVVVRVGFNIQSLAPDQENHIKEVALRGLEKDIRETHQRLTEELQNAQVQPR